MDKKELKRLQKLACISLSEEEEKKLGTQLQDIVVFLWQLNEIKIDKTWSKLMKIENSLRTLKGVNEFKDSKKLLQNVKHEILNNSIVIKSVLW